MPCPEFDPAVPGRRLGCDVIRRIARMAAAMTGCYCSRHGLRLRCRTSVQHADYEGLIVRPRSRIRTLQPFQKQVRAAVAKARKALRPRRAFSLV